MTITFPPPPPLPSPPPQVAQKVGIPPPRCRPNSDALIHLHAMISEKPEKNGLVESEFGNQLRRILDQCTPYKRKYKESVKQYFEKGEQLQQQMLEQEGAEEEESIKKIKLLKKRYAINEYNYKLCLVPRACPNRWNSYRSCWEELSPEMVGEFKQHGMVHLLCSAERKGVERCINNLVSRVLHEEDDEPSPSSRDNDLMIVP
mmetsp:Transcript_27834/g.31815  ORF Transcript_27834/g.31815 Transcript_27834/m.31815 type:complete len:203 (-) Transcript_27834:46-654(-)|eukprot:CAMPEP_0194147656 /NCGR_PEP_ID=MMETSP0152-20130528/26620_1 /TAXON_ID=1049557 /ORGANISM="Thalassiothrix antarctica, Strain L6-D1" /LENGTH=202 /DNA_ID=CAMNT_0038848617 /DNA_START=133 /DNA_END=741 /DNA_ORIENTATION=-